MEVIVADKCGFCLGVNNAIKLARKTLEEHKTVYSLGSIIHNQDVVDELSGLGLKTVDSVDKIDSGTVLIRSHGATKDQLRKIEKKHLQIADATCVLVKRIQKISLKLNEEGYKVVIIGDGQHPEVQAIVGFADDIVVAGSPEDLHKISHHSKLGVICQTTQSPEYFGMMVSEIVKHGFSELKIINTLCSEAIKRQNSSVDLCKKVDIMFVLGGLHSANTRKLADLCAGHNERTYHLQNWAELDKSVLKGVKVAGVTAGASTPQKVIAEFVENLKDFETAE